MNAPVQIEGAVYRPDGSAIVRLGQLARLDLQILGLDGSGPMVPQDLDGRHFVQRILDRDGNLLIETPASHPDATTVRFELAVTEALLPADAKAADLTHVLVELLDGDQEDDIVARPFSVRRLRAGAPDATLSVGPPDRFAVRYVGAPGASAAQQARDAGLIEEATGDALATWLRQPSVEAGAAAAAIVLEWQGLLPEAETIYGAAQQVAADRIQTGEYREATGADRQAVAADRQQTGADRQATGADRVQTQADRSQTGVDRVQTGLDRTASADHAASAAVSSGQALLRALAATGAFLLSMPADLSAAPDAFMVSEDPGIQVYSNDGETATALGFLNEASFRSPAIMKAYEGPLGPVGTRVYAGRHRYEVVATAQHLTTAAGVKLKVLPSAGGRYEIEAFEPDLSGITSANALLATVDALAVAESRPVVISGGKLLVPEALTLAADYRVEPSGRIKCDALLSINGGFKAGRHQVFEGAAVDPDQNIGPIWGAGSVSGIYPEWFSARRRASNVGPVDSYAGILCTLKSTSRSLVGNRWAVKVGEAVYDTSKTIVAPAPGLFHWEGTGRGTQLRPMAGVGGVWPDSVVDFVSSTTDSRFSKTTIHGGSSSRPVKYGIRANVELKHTHFDDVSVTLFSRAGWASADWSNTWINCEATNCKVGLLLYASANNNDINVIGMGFIGNEVDAVVGPGANVRFYGCQFQAAVAPPYTMTHIYVEGNSCVSVHNPYMETQSGGGLAGWPVDDPAGGDPVTIYAAVICNQARFFDDMDAGTITRTLSQNSAATGAVIHLDGAFVNTPAYSNAGAGGATGATYVNGPATLVAKNGQATDHACTISTSGGKVTGISAISGGQHAQIGDRMRIVQGANNTAESTVWTTGANNVITSVQMGVAAAIYPGNVRALTMTASLSVVPFLVLYNDPAVCNPKRIEINGSVRATGLLDYILVGPNTDTPRVSFRHINVNNLSHERLAGALGRDLGIQNYFTGWKFTTPPVTSTFVRQPTGYQGLPSWRWQLAAGQTASDIQSGQLTIASSGALNAELLGRRMYLVMPRFFSTTNVKLRVTLEVIVGDSIIVHKSQDLTTDFTAASGLGAEEVSILVPPLGCTLRWTAQVIAAIPGAQFAEVMAPVLAPVGWCIDQFPRWIHERPLRFAETWDPPAVAPAASITNTFAVYGSRQGDDIRVAAPGSLGGLLKTESAPTHNQAFVDLYNKTGGTVDLPSGTWKGTSTPL